MEYKSIDNFEKYVNKQILPAIKDIEKLEDKSRKHILKLVYTNLVDRFDALVDHLFLDNCRHDYILEKISGSMKDSMSEAQLLKLLMDSGNIQDAINDRLRDVIRFTILRNRHSKKLRTLFLAFECDLYTKGSPLVSPGDGKIADSPKKHNVNVPQSVCGYADWLYSRRNGIVHGSGGSKFLANDITQLKKLFKYKAPKTFRLSSGAINIAATFYLAVTKQLREANN